MTAQKPGQSDPWQVIADITSELIRGGQTAYIRCRAALGVLERAGIDFNGGPHGVPPEESRPASELAWLRELYASAVHFADTWAELLVAMPDDYGCEMNCAEANAVAGLFRVLGNDVTADAIVAAHMAHDDDEERASHDEEES